MGDGRRLTPGLLIMVPLAQGPQVLVAVIVDALGCADLVVHLVGRLTADAARVERPLTHPPVALEDAPTYAMPALG